MTSVAFASRPPRPRSDGFQSAAPAAPPAFAPRPARSALQNVGAECVATPVADVAVLPAWKPAELGSPPVELDLPADFQHLRARQSMQQHCLPPPGPGHVRRSQSEAPPTTLRPYHEHCVEDLACRPPLIRNVATFEKPREYSKRLCGIAALQQPLPSVCGSSRSSRRGSSRSQRSPIDEAIQREFMGEGLALEEAVDARRDAGWAVKHRHLQRSDVGHCCYACRQPLRDMNDEVVVWTGAAIYRRFHPHCAAGYILRADAEKAKAASGSRDAPYSDVVEGYADGWRVPRDEPDNRSQNRRAVDAARQWLLSQDPTAFSSLRGDLFTTVTITENGKKKAVPGLSHEQLHVLQTKHRWCPSDEVDECGVCSEALPEQPMRPDCPICFAALDRRSAPCVQLPCAPQHICHIECVLPWLRKASICPVCRKDLRPLLPPSRGASMPPLPARGSSQAA
jgi:hypothetical protein